MPQFEIETYEVESSIHTFGPRRRLRLVSPDLAHGIRNRVDLYFTENRPPFPNGSGVGVAANVGGLNYDGITFVVWAEPDSFGEIYDIVRNESPVYFRYDLREIGSARPGTTHRWVPWAHVTTGPELPGEGPADADAALAEVRRLMAAAPAGGDGAEQHVSEPA